MNGVNTRCAFLSAVNKLTRAHPTNIQLCGEDSPGSGATRKYDYGGGDGVGRR